MEMCSSSRCLLYAVFVLLCVDLGCGQSFKNYYNQLWRVRGSGTKTTSPSRPPLAAPSSTNTAIPANTAGQSQTGFYSQRWRGGVSRTRETFPPPVLPTSFARNRARPAGPAGQSYEHFYNQRWRTLERRTTLPPPAGPASDTTIPADVAALIPPGMTIDDIPKSQLAGNDTVRSSVC